MNGVTLAVEVSQLKNQVKQSTAKKQSENTFTKVLNERISNDVSSSENAKNNKIDDKTLQKVFKALDSDATQGEISELLEGMTSEQANDLIEIIKNILTKISDKIEKTDCSTSYNFV